MPTNTDKDPLGNWAALAMDSWLLGAEMATVIWLRGWRISAGGKLAQNELQRMMSEKLAAGITLWPAIMAGGQAQTPESMAARSLAHYRKPVKANRRRLAGGR